jgi:hypothetical protein
VVSFLLNKVRTINMDPVNALGFTPLMKSALQGRIKCSKLLLFSGKTTCSTAEVRRYPLAHQLCMKTLRRYYNHRTLLPHNEKPKANFPQMRPPTRGY